MLIMKTKLNVFLLCVFTLFLGACSTVETRSGPTVKAQHVVLLPIESLHSELLEQDNEIYPLLEQAIAKKKFVVTTSNAEQFQPALDQALADAGSIYDPSVGQFLPSDRQIYIKSLIDYYSKETTVDVLVLPELLIRNARVHGDTAAWDGVERDVELTEKPNKPYTSLREARGLSIKLSVYSRNGAFLQQSYAGISLPYTVNYNQKPAELNLKDEFMSVKEQRQAVTAVLRPFFQQVKYTKRGRK